MLIRVLGAHNCESRNSKLVSLLIDDVLALDAGSLTSSLSFRAQLKLKAVLLTHHHYDHIRDIPAIAMNALIHETKISVYSTRPVYDALAAHFLNGELYPDFLRKPAGNPTIKFTEVAPEKTENIDGYRIQAVPMNHSIPAVGFQVTSPDGKAVFYTGDTGPGLAECCRHISPQLLITEVTAPNKYEGFARDAGHLTPRLLGLELDSFQRLKGYLPRIVAVHMNPIQEKQIEAELAVTAGSLGTSITLAREGMLVHL